MAAARLSTCLGELLQELETVEPWCLEPSRLENWFDDHIQLGAHAFDRDCRNAVDEVLGTIHELSSFNNVLFDIDKVIKVCAIVSAKWFIIIAIKWPSRSSSSDPQDHPQVTLKIILKWPSSDIQDHLVEHWHVNPSQVQVLVNVFVHSKS